MIILDDNLIEDEYNSEKNSFEVSEPGKYFIIYFLVIKTNKYNRYR